MELLELMAGKSTILNILSVEQDYTYGKISLDTDKRLKILKQDHHVFDNFSATLILQSYLIQNKKSIF